MLFKLKSPTVYAIRILKHVAENEESSLSASQISKDVGMTQSYFMNIVKALKEEGLLQSSQGRYGGFTLSRSPENITLYDIVVAMERDQAMLDEVDGMGEVMQIVDDVNQYIKKTLEKISIVDI